MTTEKGSDPGGPGKTIQYSPGANHRLIMNWTSLFGLFLIGTGLFTGGTTLALDYFAAVSLAYSGILYLVYLILVIIGLMVVLAGVLLEARRRRHRGYERDRPDLVIDLRRAAHRYALGGFLMSAMLLVMGMAAGSYQIYHATESNEFCGYMCHQVMRPEAITYSYSSHARVKCVECHIGSGAEWYVRSKLSGLRQVWAVMANHFPRPVPTPIVNLRPARETCEQCHWPKKFIGYKEVVRNYFRSDEQNSPYRVRMVMKIGGEETSLMKGSGIHYHMLLASTVEYIARDLSRQDIPYVRILHENGKEEVFEDIKKPLTAEEKATLPRRKMDCMDCHNRPSHQFPTPMSLVNQALEGGSVDRTLPFIKIQAVKALDEKYETTTEALLGIENTILDYYEKNYPKVFKSESVALARTITSIQSIYQRSMFPEMKAGYFSYPDNLGHRDWPGCFRCHNDKLKTVEGNSIFTTCNKCHLIIAQGKDVTQVSVDIEKGLEFIHPDGDDAMDEYTECNECHTGGISVYE
ncbi:MAG: NapC/NirT family cytochrome c [Deltaproteobacteria bacterium]|nr:NapC/NirT family cytochrome c [Deltaproteobacteria bacterium]